MGQQLSYVQEKMFNNNAGFWNHNSVVASYFPNNCVGAIYELNEHGNRMIGSGFLVGCDLVLTVAHNICDRKLRYSRKNLIFYPGVSGNLQEGYKVGCCRYRKEFLEEQNCALYDYALLKLEQKVIKSEYLQLGLNYKLQEQALGVVGYRAASCDPQYATQSSVWWPNQHKIVGNIISHRLSTLEGVSGSPLFVKRNNKPIAIGIHFGGLIQVQCNGGRLITDDLLDDLICWEKQMSSQIKFHVMKDSTSQMMTEKVDIWLNNSTRKSMSVVPSEFAPTMSTACSVLKGQDRDISSSLKEYHLSQLSLIKREQIKEISQQSIIILDPQKQEKHIQIKQRYFDGIFKKLQAIPLAEKRRITSLTLKRTDDYADYKDEVMALLVAANHINKLAVSLEEEFSSLNKFTFYFRFILWSYQPFQRLRKVLSNPRITTVQVFVDPQWKQYEQKGHWLEGWMNASKENKKRAVYEKWDW